MIFIGLAIGFLTGWFTRWISIHKRSVGVLYVVKTKLEDKPYLFTELSENIDYVSRLDYATFKVDVKNNDSHK